VCSSVIRILRVVSVFDDDSKFAVFVILFAAFVHAQTDQKQCPKIKQGGN
jgi:hypothetical protein